MLFRNAKMKRETDLGLRKTPSRRTKPIKISEKSLFATGNGGKFFEKSFPAAGMGKNASENGFVRREGV